MKTTRLIVATVATFVALHASCQRALAQSNTYSMNIVGYVNTPFVAGGNLFSNPLSAATNRLSSLFLWGAPAGTTVSLWDYLSESYTQTSTYNGSAWSVNLTLNPGTGALLTTPAAFTNTFVGNVVYTPGPPPNNDILPSTVFVEVAGMHLLASATPVSYPGSGYSAFDVIIGRAPRNGEQFIWLNEQTQTYHTTTYYTGTGWDNGEPVLGVGDAAFFNVLPVPEPTAISLMLVGALVLGAMRRRTR